MAHSAGQQVDAMVEFDGREVSPIGLWVDGSYRCILHKGRT